MRTTHLLLPAAAAVLASGFAFVAPAQAAPAENRASAETNLTAVTLNLGTLGGPKSEARDIDGSIVVGVSLVDNRTSHAFAYDLAARHPHMRDLGSISNGSEARADGSIVVGDTNVVRGGSERTRAFAYDLAVFHPQMRDLGDLGGNYAHAYAVDGNIVTGQSDTASGEYHGFTYDLAAAEPVMRDLGTLGGDYSVVHGVDRRVVVGTSSTPSGASHAFVYDLTAAEPAMRDLGTLGGSDSSALAVHGTTVVGQSKTASGEFHAFAYDLAAAEPVMRDLGTLGGDYSSATDVDGTSVVGTSTTGSGKARVFAYDLAARTPAMKDIGTVAGGATTQVSGAEVDGDIVIGSWAEEHDVTRAPRLRLGSLRLRPRRTRAEDARPRQPAGRRLGGQRRRRRRGGRLHPQAQPRARHRVGPA